MSLGYSFFFFIGARLTGALVGGGAPSSGNSGMLNPDLPTGLSSKPPAPLPPPMGMSSNELALLAAGRGF